MSVAADAIEREGIERLQRFVSVYDHSLAQLPFRPYRVDLRYPNGFAVRAAAFAQRAGGA